MSHQAMQQELARTAAMIARRFQLDGLVLVSLKDGRLDAVGGAFNSAAQDVIRQAVDGMTENLDAHGHINLAHMN